MKRKLFAVGLGMMSLISILVPVLVPSTAFAVHNALKSNVFDPTILAGPLTLCVGAQSSNSGGNILPTCSDLCDLVAQIAQVIYCAIAVVIWIIAPILIAVGGIRIMLGGANPEMIAQGKKTITGVVWGIVIVLLAWLIVYTFVNAFGSLGSFVGGFGGQGGSASCLAPGSQAYTCGTGGGIYGTCPNGKSCQQTNSTPGFVNTDPIFGCQ